MSATDASETEGDVILPNCPIAILRELKNPLNDICDGFQIRPRFEEQISTGDGVTVSQQARDILDTLNRSLRHRALELAQTLVKKQGIIPTFKVGILAGHVTIPT